MFVEGASPYKLLSIFILLVNVLFTTSQSQPVLFLDSGQFVYSFFASVSTGSILPNELTSTFTLKGLLEVQKSIDSPVLAARLTSLKQAIHDNTRTLDDANYERMDDAAEVLKLPFVVNLNPEGTIGVMNFTGEEKLWSMNVKRAIAASFQMQTVGRSIPGAFKISEPCIHGVCIAEYSSSDGINIRKSYNIPTHEPSPTHDLWMSVMMNVCSKDIKNPLIGNTDKWYILDDKGLLKLVSQSTIEVHYHNHIFRSHTKVALEKLYKTDDLFVNNYTFPIMTTVAFQPPSRNEPTGGRAPFPEGEQLDLLWAILGKIADGLEQLDLTDALLKDKLPLRLQEILSTLSFETLKKAYEELELGTSYKWETMKNIFLEVLPQVKSKAAILVVRDLVVNKNIYDELTMLQLLRKMPFSAGDLSQELLVEMEPLMKLNQDFSLEVRHAAILAFATLVHKAFIVNACTSDTFEDYVQLYFSRFTESPDYADRLVWLSGLSNLQLQRVTSYLAPVITGTLGHSSNERFLAVWATMPLAPMFSNEVHNIYWPILHNGKEVLEMRVAALTMLLLAEPTPHRLLSIHWYISSQSNNHLTNFFYTTVRSLEKTTFDCYKHMAKLASYLSKIIQPPINQKKVWSTGNYIFDMADASRDMGFLFQAFSIANILTDLPETMYFTLITHNSGLIVQDYAMYLKLQGVVGNILGKFHQMTVPQLIETLHQLKVQPNLIQPVHVEILLKYQGKIVTAMHFNQTNFNKWSEEVKNFTERFLKIENHVNQQYLLYPTIVRSILPSEIGTPIITDSVLSSLSSVRGNLTHSISQQEIIRKNDIHLRSSTLAILSLSAYNPIKDTYHVADVAQVSDAYFPANFTIGLNLMEKSLKTTWYNPKSGQSPGFIAYSGSKITTVSYKSLSFNKQNENHAQGLVNTGNNALLVIEPGVTIQCHGPTTASELFWQVITSHSSNTNVFPYMKPLMFLIHGFVLGTIPAKGPCELILSAEKYNNRPKRTDSEIKLTFFTDESLDILIVDFGTITRFDDQERKILSALNVTTEIHWKDDYTNFSIKAVDKTINDSKEWKACFSAEENFLNSGYENIDSFYAMTESKIGLSFGYTEESCPIDGTVLLMFIKPNISKDTLESFNVHVTLKDIPAEYAALFSRSSNALDILQSKPPFEGYESIKFILNELSKSNVSMNATIFTGPKSMKINIESDDNSVSNVWETSGPPLLLNSKYKWQFLKETGIIKECRITTSAVNDFHNETTKLSSSTNCELLVVGECTNSPQFAVLRLPSENDLLALRLYMGENYADIHATKHKFHISINGQEVAWRPSYKFPENESFYEFKISGTDQKINVISNIVAFEVIYTRQEALISIPTSYIPLTCGACIQTKTLHTKC